MGFQLALNSDCRAILDTTPEGRGKDWYPRLIY